MLKKRNLEASEKLHNETHANYKIFKNIEKIRQETERLEDKLALAETILGGVRTVAEDKVPKAVAVLEEKADMFNSFREKIYRDRITSAQGDISNLLRHTIKNVEDVVQEQNKIRREE